jgi:hypothetical protein
MALGAAGIAVAVSQSIYADSEGVLHGCVNKKTGALRVVLPGAACKSTENALSWNQVGEAGPQGPAGARGETGPQGEPGPAGTLSALDDLHGTACTTHRGLPGSVVAKPFFDGRETFGVNVLCLGADKYEPNDTRETAATPPVDLSLPLRLNAASTFPEGDVDWYRWTRPVNFGFLLGSVPDKLTFELYRDGVLVASGVNTYTAQGGTVPIYRSPDTLEHVWELKVTSTIPSEYSMST